MKKYDYSVGSIHESNNYGSYEILELDHRNKYRNAFFKIRFIETGYECVVSTSAIVSGRIKDHSYDFNFSIGSKHLSNNSGVFEILGLNHIGNNSNKYYDIKFEYTGYTTVAVADCIIHGVVNDPYYPNIFGVACTGVLNLPWKETKRLYSRWYNMIGRCYNCNDKDYHNYGAIGVRVCDRWLCFEYYYKDIPSLPGYENYVKNPQYYQIDKDYLQQHIPREKRIYSPDTCCFLSAQLNTLYTSKAGINNNTGYYGVYKYGATDYYMACLKYNSQFHILGVYKYPEMAAGCYNYFVIAHRLNIPLNNNVCLPSMEELIKYDIRKSKVEMIKYAN